MLKETLLISFIVYTGIMFMPELLLSQSWNLVKERDGVSTYTRTEPGFSVKAYKCET